MLLCARRGTSALIAPPCVPSWRTVVRQAWRSARVEGTGEVEQELCGAARSCALAVIARGEPPGHGARNSSSIS